VSVVSIQPGESLDAPRGAAVVCIETGDTGEAPDACVRSVLAHTDADVPVVICEDRAAVLAAAAPADVVLVDPRTVVAAGWFEGLRHAAETDGTVATASAITSEATAGLGIDAAAQRVRERSLRIRPRLQAPHEGCVYVRRAAIELVGVSGDMRSFADRCVRAGMTHLLADDVLVHASGRALAAEDGPLASALSSVRRALTGMSITIDARILSRPITGTEVHVLELIAALARTDAVRLRVIVPDRPSGDAARALEALPSVELIRYDQARDRADVVHRPYQLSDPGELTFLASLGERLVLTHQDLIAYHNPSYFPDVDAWRGYRELTALALATADHVVFFSAHARDDALAEELVDPTRASVVHIGVDHALTGSRPAPRAPAGADELDPSADVVLCIGTDYAHKNRVFALRVLDQLRRRHGWRGYLVFAGPSVPYGSSRAEEEQLRARLAESVIDVGAVSEDEKEWLLTRARVVLYPTLHEGFGLVPFEAAEHAKPCMWAAGTSLSELLRDDGAAIVPWDAAASADRAFELLTDVRARGLQVAAVHEQARQLTWDVTAGRLLEVYESVCGAPGTTVQAPQLSEDAMRLVGPGGALPTDVQRPLLALATHPRLGRPVFGALRAGYRAISKLRRWASDQSRR
jgi:glycosyltransferase involved in cell wall biosynthesis